MIFHHPDFLVPPQALGALRAVRDVRVRSAGPAYPHTWALSTILFMV